MWFDDMDIGGRGIVQPAKGPLGRALRAARHDIFVSQKRLADAAGVSQAAVSRLERGTPSWRLFCQLIEVMGGRPVVTIERVPTDREFLASLDDGWID
jgi:predicted transcriptional regulator